MVSYESFIVLISTKSHLYSAHYLFFLFLFRPGIEPTVIVQFKGDQDESGQRTSLVIMTTFFIGYISILRLSPNLYFVILLKIYHEDNSLIETIYLLLHKIKFCTNLKTD